MSLEWLNEPNGRETMFLDIYLGQSIQEWTKWNLWMTAFKNIPLVHSYLFIYLFIYEYLYMIKTLQQYIHYKNKNTAVITVSPA